MELKQGMISITQDELYQIRRKGWYEMEQVLTEAMKLGYSQGYTDSEAETDVEFRLAEEDRAQELCQALEENNRRWKQAVKSAVAALTLVSRKRKAQMLSFLQIELERTGICRR